MGGTNGTEHNPKHKDDDDDNDNDNSLHQCGRYEGAMKMKCVCFLREIQCACGRESRRVVMVYYTIWWGWRRRLVIL